MDRKSAGRAARFGCGLIASAVIAAACVAVPVGAVADRGPSGSLRATAFHLALALSDDAAREAVRNSLALAVLVAALASGIGVGLARLLARGGRRGAEALAAAGRIPGAVPPLFAALGLAAVAPASWDGAWRWVALGWVQIAWGVPRVMAAASSAFAAAAPSWQDAARMAGASRARAWWASSWPPARPKVARAAAEVFALALLDPGGPMALGVRRSLGFQVVEAALAPDRLGRAAALGAIGLALALVARSAILAWGGPGRPIPDRSRSRGRTPTGRPAASASMVALLAWTLFALGPIACLIASSLGLNGSGRVRFDGFASIAADADARSALVHSIVLGLGATAAAAGLARVLGPLRERPSLRVPTSWPDAVPPLAIALGLLLLPGQLDALATRAGPLAGLLRAVADALDPFRSPWVPLLAAVAILRLPALREAFEVSRRADSPSARDVARTSGATPLAAWATASAPRAGSPAGSALAWSVAASALDSCAALLLAPTLAARPLAPAALDLASASGGLAGASALAVVALAFPAAAWALSGARVPGRDRVTDGTRRRTDSGWVRPGPLVAMRPHMASGLGLR